MDIHFKYLFIEKKKNFYIKKKVLGKKGLSFINISLFLKLFSSDFKTKNITHVEFTKPESLHLK